MLEVAERRAVISGIGQTDIGRRLRRLPLDLTLEASLAAIEDAGLEPADIDGISTFPGNVAGAPGFSGVGVAEVHEALRLNLNWYSGGPETPGQLGSVVNACLAVASGLAKHVLCFRTVTEGSAQADRGRAGVMPGMSGGVNGETRARRFDGWLQWVLPFGAPSPANWFALMAQRHFYEYGTTREQLAWIAINARRHAALNPKAIYTDPMDLDDYMSARMISSPLCLYDCDVPADASTAVIVSAAETAPTLRRPPVGIEAVGCAIHGRPSWDQWDDLTTMAVRDAATMMWQRTELRPSDVDVAELYDGFSFITLACLEALGFCGKGEGGPFVDGGERIGLTGELPLNTQGGQLSGGRAHGYGFLHEACVQLRGEADRRQVGGGPEVAVVAVGGGPAATCMLLTRPR